MDARGCLLIVFVLIFQKLSANPINDVRNCQVADIPVAPEFSFSQLEGVWYILARTTPYGNSTWQSVIWKFVQGEDGTILCVVNGYMSETSTCADGHVTLLEATDEPGTYTSIYDKEGAFRVVHVDTRTSLLYVCFKPDDDGTCSGQNRMVVYGSRDQSVTLEDRETLDQAMSDECLNMLELHYTPQGLCKIPYTKRSLVSSSVFDRAAPVRSVYARRGQTLTLTCNTPPPESATEILSSYKVVWTKISDVGTVALTLMTARITDDIRISATQESFTNWHLHISDVQQEDEGVYMCMNNNEKKIRFIVTVLESPQILDSEDSFTADVGDTVVLNCPAVGTPTPFIVWYLQDQFNNKKERCGDTKLDLVFILETSTAFGVKNINLAMDFVRFFMVPANIDSGNVRVGFVNYSSNVDVQFHLSDYRNKQKVYKAMHNVTMENSDEVNTAYAIRAARTQMFKTRNGDRSGVSNVIILISQGGLDSPDGRAVDEALMAKSQGIHMYVISSSTVNLQQVQILASEPVQENSFTLANFEQLKELRNTMFQSHCPEPDDGGQRLTLTDVTKDEIGHYQCVVDNGINPAVSKTFTVDVKFAPEITINSRVIRKRLGQSATMTCYVEASPMDEDMQWRYKGERITTDLRHAVTTNEEGFGSVSFSLRIGSLEEDDFGVYTCAATNSIGTAEATIQLAEIKIDDQCDLARTTVQENFNLWEFLGEWYRVKALKYRFGNNTYVSESLAFFIDRGGYLSIVYRGKSKDAECSDPGVFEFEQETPGKYRYKDEDHATEIYQFVYTDYTNAVIFVCSEMDEDGHCPDENIHVEIITKSFPIPADMMAELEAIVEDLCVNLEDMQEATYGECEFPPGYLESVGYGSGGVNEEYLCDVERTRVHADFDINQFVGEWQNLKTTTFRYGTNTSVSESLHYFIRADGQLVLAHRGFSSAGEKCSESGHMELNEVYPGKYTTQYKGNTGSIQVVHTDYNHAVTMSCSKVAENGLCPAEHVNVQIISKQQPVPEAVMKELESYVSTLCINVGDMLDNVPGLCDIPISYLESAGFLRPESCIVNEMGRIENFNKYRFIGTWNIIKTTSNPYGNLTYLTAVQNYFLKPDGALATAYRGYIKGINKCRLPGTVVFEKDAHGNYVFQSLNGHGVFKIIYTDYNYAVTYSCRQVGSDGRCVSGYQHATVLARDEIVDPDTLRMLERYVKQTCVDPNNLIPVIPGLCTIPAEFLKSVGYIGPDRCQVVNIPIQANFDLNRFLGKWKTLKTLTYYHGNNTYTSMTHKYFLNDDDQLTLAFRGYNHTSNKCAAPQHVVFEERSPGYFVMPENETYHIVYTDYDYAIVYLCGELRTDGHCVKEKTQVSILSRHDTIPDDLLQSLLNNMSGLCVNTDDLVDVAPDLCLISASYMTSAGYTGPPEDECQLSVIPHQEDLNVTALNGDWYVLMTTHVQDLPLTPTVGPVYYYFEDWHLIALFRLVNVTTGLCGPAEAWNSREATGPGDYYNFAGTHPIVFRILHASQKYIVTYSCMKELDSGTCAHNHGQASILARANVIPTEDLVMLKKYVTHGCLDSNDLKHTENVECPIRESIKAVARDDLISDDHVVIGCHMDYVPVQENLDIYKFADTMWNTLWRSSSIWGNTSLVPGHRKKVVVSQMGEDEEQLFLISRSFKFSWDSCEPMEVLKLTVFEQPGDYTLSFGDSSTLSGMYRVMYADDEYAVTYSCFDTTSGTTCPHDSLLVEILSIHKDIPEDKLFELQSYANEVCIDVNAMAQTDPDACTLPDSIVQAVQAGQITTDYALPVAGCDGNLIKIDPYFDLSLFTQEWHTIYSSIPWDTEGSSLTTYYQETDGGVAYARKIYNVSMGQCNPTESGILLERSVPGDYATLLEGFPVIIKILHIDETSAVSFVCLGLDEDGTCRRDQLIIHFLSLTNDMSDEDVVRLKPYVKGTCAEAGDIVRQSPGVCEIQDNIKAAVEDGEITSYYSTIECSMDYIETQDVTLEEIAGPWPKSYNTQQLRQIEGTNLHISPLGDGSEGYFLVTLSNYSMCMKTLASKATMVAPGSFSGILFGQPSQLKILYADDTELVWYVCTAQKEDGTCKPGHDSFSISSRNAEIPPEKFAYLEKYKAKVCMASINLKDMKSMCPLSEEIQEAARNGEFTSDETIVSCLSRFIPVQKNFDATRFAGKWHGIAYASYLKGYEMLTSKVFNFGFTKTGQMVLFGRLYDQSVYGCRPTVMRYLMETETPGHFTIGTGNMTRMAVIFTDYTNAVLYWCGRTEPNGRCASDQLFVEIISRNVHVDSTTRGQLQRYMRQGCLEREEDVIDNTLEQCQIPLSISDAIIAGEIGYKGVPVMVQCMERFIEPQRNFDKHRFAGQWYSVGETHFIWGNNTWDNKMTTFRVLDDGSFVFSATGYANYAQSCVEPTSTELVPGTEPGHFTFVDRKEEVTLKVVYTDYNVAIFYICYLHNADGQCYKNRQIVQIMSRTKGIDEDTYRSLRYYIVNLCVEVKDIVLSNYDLCEFPRINEDAIQRKICSFNDIVPTSSFTFLQMAGLWYEVARTRFTFNKMETSVIFYNYLTEVSMLEGLFTGSLKGVCQNKMTSLTKKHEEAGEPDSHLLGRLGGFDSSHPWVSFKILYFDGRYLMYYACYNDHDDGTCPQDKTEVTLYSRVKQLNDEIKSKIPRLMKSVCLKTADLIESSGTDCTQSLFAAPQKPKAETIVNVKCSPLAGVPVDDNIRDIELVGRWKVAEDIGFSSGLPLSVIIRRHTDTTFKIIVSEGNHNTTSLMKPRCSDESYGDYISSLGSTNMGQWSSLKIVHSDIDTTILYWCLREEDDGTCHHTGVRMLLLTRRVPMEDILKKNHLRRINDACVSSIPKPVKILAYGSIPGAVIVFADEIQPISRAEYNTRKVATSFCAVDNIKPVNFDQARISGIWYEIARTPDPLLTMEATVGYYLPVGNGDIKMIFSGLTGDRHCKDPMVGTVRPRCPGNVDGNYQGRLKMPNSYLWITWKVLYTDYDQSLLAMSCMDEDELGMCRPNGTRIHIMSRSHGLHNDVRAKLNNRIDFACMNPKSLTNTAHDGSCRRIVADKAKTLMSELSIDPCPTYKGYISVASPRLCYKLSEKNDTRDYLAAEAECNKVGHLIDLDTPERYDYIYNVTNNMGSAAFEHGTLIFRIWVGMKRDSNDVFKWSSGESYVRKWAAAEPDEPPVQRCVQLLPDGLSDMYCSMRRRYLCEIPM